MARKDAVSECSGEESYRTAVHEAGHAVMAFILKCGIERVSIEPDEAAGLLGTFMPTRPLTFAAFNRDLRTLKRMDDEVMISLAGVAAVSAVLKQRSWDGAESDLDIANWIAKERTLGAGESEAYLEWLYTRTELLLRRDRNKHAIRTLASELLQRGAVSGRKAREIIRAANEKGASNGA